MAEILRVEDLTKYFATKKGTLHAVDGVTFGLREGQTLGIVGESGCGKSTLGRVILHLHQRTGGRIIFQGKDISDVTKAQLKELRKDMQIIFQDPYASLNPRMSIGDIIAEPLKIYKLCNSKEEQQKKVREIMDVVLDEAKIGVASMLGSRVRVKTWSWFADDKQEIRQGGFAGWLTDGTPLWVTGSGTSKTVLTRYATVLNRVLPVPTQVASGQCVEVELFARYPLKKITAEKSTTAVKPGVLNGRYRVTFTNGNHITFVSHGETTLLSEKGKLKLQSHLDREEYVARVLDREAKSTPPEAAKAMTVAIRTFLQQNANREGDCLTIPDSSATQRVSASPATTGARTMAAWTQDLIYAGDPVHYHGSRATEGTLSWRQATA